MIKAHFKKQMQTPGGMVWLDIDLNIAQGEFITLFGESGAGKTTFLRILAGLTQAEEGAIKVGGQVWFDSHCGTNLAVPKRSIGFVFQESSLFPNMTVRENLEYACRGQKSVQEWINTLGLNGLEGQRPSQLSGGQKQKVALARAIVRQPQILLLDEPLSDLDISARLNLQDVIIKVYQKTGITTILVSHNLSEIFKLSKKVFVLEHGKITKTGSPQEVFVKDNLSSKFKFTGEIIKISKDGVLNILTLSIGNQVIKMVASDEEISGLTVGSNVVVASKAFKLTP